MNSDSIRQGTLYVFPGLGSEYPLMLTRYIHENPSELDLLRQVIGPVETDLILKYDGLDESDKLHFPDRHLWMQKSIFAFSILQWRRIVPKPLDALAGHSLGFYAAAVASKALIASDALRVLTEVYHLTRRKNTSDSISTWVLNGRKPGWMENLKRREDIEILAVNDPFQVVICGKHETIERFHAEFKDDIVKAILVDSAAPIHSRQWEKSTEILRTRIFDLPIVSPQQILWSHTTCETLTTADSIREELCKQIARPVRWEVLMNRIRDLGFEHIHDMGPNKILRQMAFRFEPKFQLSYSDFQKSRKSVTKSVINESKVIPNMKSIGFDRLQEALI